MKAKIKSFEYKGPQSGVLTLDLKGDFRETFDRLKDVEIELTVEKWHPARSLTANAYAWHLINKIAEKMREPPVEVYRRYVRDVGCKTHVVCVQADDVEKEVDLFLEGHLGRMVDIAESKIPGCAVIYKKYGSSDYDSSQMAAFIQNIVDDCHDIGIETKSEEELQSMIGAWK